MASVPTTGLLFEETQWFYRRWWGLMLGLTVVAVGPLALAVGKPHGVKALLIAVPLLGLGLTGLWFMQLTVRIDAFGIHYRYIPVLNRWQHWPWSGFRQVYSRTYSPLGDYGGWGVRGTPHNLAYNVWGPAGLQLVFQNGDKLLLGTQRPTELNAVLMALQAADASRPIKR